MSRTSDTGEKYVKTSVSLPPETLADARARAGSRGLSAYITELLQQEERRLALAEFLEWSEAENGPIPEEILEEVRQRLPWARDVL